MITFEELKEVILKFGLKPVSTRNMPLFSFSCVALGYTKLLRERLDFSYEAVAAFGETGQWHSFFNESDIAAAMEKFLRNKKFLFADTINRVNKDFSELEKAFIKSKNDSVLERIRAIYAIYPKYMSCIGVYNCFWRYIGNDEHKEGLTSVDIKKISGGRELLAKFYPKVEQAMKDCTSAVGKRKGFEGDLIRYLTYSEMGQYLDGELSVGGIAGELSLRREKYFYLYIEKKNREEVVTDKKVIEKICAGFYDVSPGVMEVKGFSVCKGVVRGRVYKTRGSHNTKLVPAENFVLVTSMTHPDDLSLMKKCVAIVTDEGGILSHAAVMARELKKPCIIGTKIATKILKDGDMVEVDANNGVARLLK